MKAAIGVTIGVLAVVIAGASLYGIFSLNETIQAKPNPIQVSNYSAQLGSLQPQINSINNNVSSLTSLKSDVSDIKGKLSDLETKLNQAQQQQAVVITNPAITVGRTIYLEGDVVHISASGLDPQKDVQVQLLDNGGYLSLQQKVTADSAGKLAYDLTLPSNITPGNYQVRLVSGLLTLSQPISITAYSGSNSGVILSNLSYQFIAVTDKSVYSLGEVIEVSGFGVPNTNISSVLTSPSGITYALSSTVQPDGTFAMFYNNFQLYETGSWHVTVNNQGLSRVLYLTIVQPSSTPFTFTARTDKTDYQAGDSIWVSGVGLPFTTVSSVLTSPSGATYTVSTTAGSDGSYILSHGTSLYSELGFWSITLTDAGETRQLSAFVGSSSSSSSPFTFTAQTQKAFYTKGEPIQVSGVGLPYTTVKADFTSPSQTTYHVAASSSSDGSYTISFPTFSSFETGNWLISVTNWQETKTLSIFLQP